MDKKTNKKDDINIRVEKCLKKRYKKYCSENNLCMSKHIREFIQNVVEDKHY